MEHLAKNSHELSWHLHFAAGGSTNQTQLLHFRNKLRLLALRFLHRLPHLLQLSAVTAVVGEASKRDGKEKLETQRVRERVCECECVCACASMCV